MEVDAGNETKSSTVEQPKAVTQQTADSKPTPPVADVLPTAEVQPSIIQTPVDTQSTVIQSSSDALPTVVIKPSNDAQPTIVIEPSEVDSVDSNTNDSATMEIDDKPDELSLTSGTPAVNEKRSEPEKRSPLGILAGATKAAPALEEVKTNLPNVQVNNPPITQSVNNVQPAKVALNDVQPSEKVSVTENDVQKIQKPTVTQTMPAVTESEPVSGYTTLIQVTAPTENQTVSDDLTTTASNGNNVCNNVPPLNKEETVKICKCIQLFHVEIRCVTHILCGFGYFNLNQSI